MEYTTFIIDEKYIVRRPTDRLQDLLSLVHFASFACKEDKERRGDNWLITLGQMDAYAEIRLLLKEVS